jgi:hypothetical protein
VLRKTFEPEMEEVNRGWTELYGEKLHDVWSSSDIVRNNKKKAIEISINIKVISFNYNYTWKDYKYPIVWVCVCSFRYLACNVHVPYWRLWPNRLYIILPHYLITARFQKKKVFDNEMSVSTLPTNLYKIFLIITIN